LEKLGDRRDEFEINGSSEALFGGKPPKTATHKALTQSAKGKTHLDWLDEGLISRQTQIMKLIGCVYPTTDCYWA